MRYLKSAVLMILMTILAGCITPPPEMEGSAKRSIFPTFQIMESTAVYETPHSVIPTAIVPSQIVMLVETPSHTLAPQSLNVTPMSNLPGQTIATIPICQNNGVAVQPPTTFHLPGLIIYQDSGMEEIRLVGGNPIKNWKLPIKQEGSIHFLGVSQDGERLAYTDSGFFGDKDFLTSKPTVEVYSETIQEAKQVVDMSNFKPLLEKFQASRIGGWRASSYQMVDDQLIPMSIALVSDTSTNNNTDVVFGLLNPFNGKWVNGTYADLAGWDPNYYVAFSPDMERALYVSGTTNQVILWDVKNKEILWQKPNLNLFSSSGEVYKWSSDGSRAAYMVSLEDGITSITRDGIEIPIRQILDQGSYKYFLTDFQLSSDGYLVALLYRLYNSELDIEKKMLLIYDFRSQNYILQCPISLSENYIIWSPDNRFLAGGMKNLELSQTPSPLRVFDIQDKIVYQLADNGSTVDWIEQFPFTSP